MIPTVYHDLTEFGLRFVTQDNSAFSALVRKIQSCPQPWGPLPTADLEAAAVLLNESGKAIITLTYIWRFTTADGQIRTSQHSNLGSSMQIDVLAGRSKVVQDRASFILPGSKRLITQEGMFGDNFDVLPPESAQLGGGYAGSRSGGGIRRRGSQDDIARIELQLDNACFEDGLCVGPDESALFESLTEDLELQRKTAEQIVQALENGASAGQVFEILRPLARHQGSEDRASRRSLRPAVLLTMFANMAINRLINVSSSELLTWFERAAQPSSIRLHRPL